MASIRKRGSTYQITVSNGRDINGKQIIETTTYVMDKSLTPKQQEKALQKFAMDFEEQVKTGNLLSGDKITFSAFIEKWKEDYAVENIAETTLSGYEFQLKDKILPVIGNMKLSNIKALHLQDLYKQLLNNGQSPSSIKRIHGIIGSIMTRAYKWNVIKENPCSRVELPKIQNNKEVKCFTIEQAEIFLKALNIEYSNIIKGHSRTDDTGKIYYVKNYTEIHSITTQFKVLFNIALFGGLRRGELIALTWDDVDFNTNSISINKSTAFVGKKMVTKEPKTKTSIRLITLPTTVMDLLKNYRKEYLQYKLSLGSQWGKNEKGEDNNYIFIQWNGNQMHLSTPTHKFKEILVNYNKTVENEANKLPLIRLHDLRHTSATLLISQNVDIRTVSERLGHAQTSTTLNIYAHALKELDKKAANTLENLLVKKA